MSFGQWVLDLCIVFNDVCIFFSWQRYFVGGRRVRLQVGTCNLFALSLVYRAFGRSPTWSSMDAFEFDLSSFLNEIHPSCVGDSHLKKAPLWLLKSNYLFRACENCPSCRFFLVQFHLEKWMPCYRVACGHEKNSAGSWPKVPLIQRPVSKCWQLDPLRKSISRAWSQPPFFCVCGVPNIWYSKLRCCTVQDRFI